MKKILSVLLCICMVMTLIPATVMANEINGVYINDINFPMGDGSTTTYYKNGGTAGSESDWNAKLYDDNGTLTLVLNGFEYNGEQTGIYATEDLKIVLEGINSITTTSTLGYGIWVQGDLEITGNGISRIDIDAEGDYAIEANTQLYVDNKNPDEYATITINSVTEVQAKGRVGAISAEEAVVIIDSYIEPVGSDFGIKGGGYYQGQAKNITIKGKSDVYASGHTPFYSAPIVDGAFEWSNTSYEWWAYTADTQYDEEWEASCIWLRYDPNGGNAGHTHPVCGDDDCADSHGDVEWTEWTSGNSLPNAPDEHQRTVPGRKSYSPHCCLGIDRWSGHHRPPHIHWHQIQQSPESASLAGH